MIKADSVILCAVVLMDRSSLKVDWYFVFLDSGLHHLYFLYSPSFTILNFISREALAPSKFRLSYLASSLPQCSCLTPEACHRQMTHRAFKGSWVPGSRRVWLRNIKHVHTHVHAPYCIDVVAHAVGCGLHGTDHRLLCAQMCLTVVGSGSCCDISSQKAAHTPTGHSIAYS